MTKDKAILTLSEFINPQQLLVMSDGCAGEEGQFFLGKLAEFAERVETMPKTYEQDGMGDQAVVFLHYFKGSCDWYVTEKDMGDPETPGQHQAFGRVHMHGDAELGYISIVELLANDVELDLHFVPITFADMDAKKAEEEEESRKAKEWLAKNTEEKMRALNLTEEDLEAEYQALRMEGGAM